jgi:hypothetical protein
MSILSSQHRQATLSRERLGLLLGFVGMAIFGGTLPATRIAVSAIDPVALTAMRTTIAGICRRRRRHGRRLDMDAETPGAGD